MTRIALTSGRIDKRHDVDQYEEMRRITANLPENILRDAMRVTGKGITETLIEGLERLRRTSAYEKAMALRGKIKLEIDMGQSRERRS